MNAQSVNHALIAVSVVLIGVSVALRSFQPILFAVLGAGTAWSILNKHANTNTPSEQPVRRRSHRPLSTSALDIASHVDSIKVQSIPLNLDNGPLTNVVNTLFQYIVRDFIESWYNKHFKVIGVEDRSLTFPSAINLSLNTFAMKFKSQVLHIGAGDFVVDLATRFCDDLVDHLQLCQIDKLPPPPSDHDYSAHIAAIHKYTLENPSSDLAMSLDPKAQNFRLFLIATRLSSAFLATQDAHHPVLSPLIRNILVSSVLIPAVNLVASPKFINTQFVNSLDASNAPAEVPESFLKVHAIQSRSHSSEFLSLNSDHIFLVVEYLGNSNQIPAKAHKPTSDHSVHMSLVFDSLCSFSLGSTLDKPSGSITFDLCRKIPKEQESHIILGRGSCGLTVLPHVEWVKIFQQSTATEEEPIKSESILMEIFFEIEAGPVLSNPAVTAAIALDYVTQSPMQTPVHPDMAPQTKELVNVDSLPNNERVGSITDIAPLSKESENDRGILIPHNPLNDFEPAPKQHQPLDFHEWDSLTLDAILTKDELRADFSVYLETGSCIKGKLILDLMAEIMGYVETTTKLDLSDPQSRAAIQQHAYQIFEQYLALPSNPSSQSSSLTRNPSGQLNKSNSISAHELIPRKMVFDLEELIVLDPSPVSFSTVTEYLHGLVHPHVRPFGAQRAASVRASMTVPELVDNISTRQSVRKTRSKSVSTYDRPLWTGEAEQIDVLREKYTHLVQGKYVSDMGFTTSCINTLSWQLMVVDRLIAHSLMQGVEDTTIRLQSQKTQIECTIVALEPLLISPNTTYSNSLMASSSSPENSRPTSAMSLVSNLTLTAQSLRSAAENTTKKRFDFKSAMRKGAESMNKGSVNVSTKFKQRLSNFSISSSSSPVEVPRSNSATPSYFSSLSRRTASSISDARSLSVSQTSAHTVKEPAQDAQPESQSGPITISSIKPSAELSIPSPPDESDIMDALSTTQAEVLISGAFSVVKQVFALNGIRVRIFDALASVLRPTLAYHIQQRFLPLIGRLSDSEMLSSIIQKGLLDTLWPNGQLKSSSSVVENIPEPTPSMSEKEDRLLATRAHQVLESALPESIARVLGSNAATGLSSTFTILQIEAFNKSLIISLLESVTDSLVTEN